MKKIDVAFRKSSIFVKKKCWYFEEFSPENDKDGRIVIGKRSWLVFIECIFCTEKSCSRRRKAQLQNSELVEVNARASQNTNRRYLLLYKLAQAFEKSP